MKKYVEPNLNIVYFESEDVMATSAVPTNVITGQTKSFNDTDWEFYLQ